MTRLRRAVEGRVCNSARVGLGGMSDGHGTGKCLGCRRRSGCGGPAHVPTLEG